eukprot:TRINITY_DN18281_c0_g1_i1.p1 TRINITY_DN18281_c0_g1~~TRINITY_DN18281_c0_g1_i1.p1  ORF type:complete len:672 (+),score=129.94 TRINITY_DN18281_c0_g1_i1:75-2090(+)
MAMLVVGAVTRTAIRRVASSLPQRRCRAAPAEARDVAPTLQNIVEEVRQERPHHETAVLKQYPRVAEVVAGVKGADDLSHVVTGLRAVAKIDVPKKPMELLMCLDNRIEFTDLQCLQLGLWFTQDGHVTSKNVEEFCRVFGRLPLASYRTHSLLCVTAARMGAADVALRHYQRLATLSPKWLRRNVKWGGLVPQVLKSVGWDGARYDAVVAAACDAKERSLFDGLLLASAYAGRATHFRTFVELAERHVGYRADSEDGLLHRSHLLLAIGHSTADEQQLIALLTALQKKCGRVDIRMRYPKLERAVSIAGKFDPAVRKRCHELLRSPGGAAAAPSSTSAAEEGAPPELCYDYKMGVCRTPQCTKVHALVRCPKGRACTTPRCPYVHPDEIAWRWAKKHIGTLPPAEDNDDGEASDTPLLRTAPGREEREADSDGPLTAVEEAQTSEGVPPPPPPSENHTGSDRSEQRPERPRPTKQRDHPYVQQLEIPRSAQQPTRRTAAVVAGWQDRTLDAPETTEHGEKSMSCMKKLLSNLLILDEQRQKEKKRASEMARRKGRRKPPAARLATYQRVSLDPVGKTAAERLLEACEAKGDGEKVASARREPPLPSFKKELSATSAASLLSVLVDHRAGRSSSGVPPPPELPKPLSRSAPAGSAPSTDSSWYDDISKIMG